MKLSITDLVVLFLPFVLQFVEANGKTKSSKGFENAFFGHGKPRFISFDSEDGKIHIDWDVTIPFASIPLHHKYSENGEISPLLHVNTNAIGIAGILTAIISFVVPLFTAGSPESHYRSNEFTERSHFGSVINEMIFGNNYVTPCMQRIVCSLVSMASRAENPTSTEKIIDGLSSHKWFKDVTNGTIIQDAVKIGREGNRDCGNIYKDCLVTPRLLKSIMNQFGMM